jgi:hypothetical protein
MLKRLFPLFTIILFTLSGLGSELTAQSSRKIIREANQLMEVGLYQDAIEILDPLVKENHAEATLLSGFSRMSNEDKLDQAIDLLSKAAELYPLKKNSNNETLEAHFYLGQAYRLNGQAKKACEKFRKVKAHTNNPEFIANIDQEIKYCENFIALRENPVDREIEHMGKIINSPYEDHSPIVLYDESTIYFTSTRPIDTLETQYQDFENIFVSHWRNHQWTEPKVLEIPGYREAHRATVGLTPDGQGLIFFQNDGYQGALYITYRTFDGWTMPEQLPPPINSGFNETHASFTPDGNTIFFSSERPGGLGGKDIYYSNKLPDGTWGKPLNAGKKINTALDEEGPFIHPDGKTLFFSSSSHNSMGGYDIFKSTRSGNDEWSEPENIGYPINTPTDDLFYLPVPNGQRVYYASQQSGGLGQSDLFVLHFPPSDNRSMAVVSSHIFNSNNQPAENAVISVNNLTTNQTEGTFRPNPQTGKFVAIIPTAQEYELVIESEGHQQYSKTFDLETNDDYKSKNRAIYLPAITLKSIPEQE